MRQLKKYIVSLIVRIIRLLPLKKAIVFESYLGKRVDLNILYLMAIDVPYDKYFVCDGALSIDELQLSRVKIIKKPSLRYLITMARASIIVTNSRIHQNVFKKKKQQCIIQLWHGIPWKKLVYDQQHITFHHKTKDEYLSEFSNDVMKWNYLWVPSVEAEEKLVRAFRYQGEVIRSMYPADVVLLNQTPKSDRYTEWKSKYKTIVLYMPTFREQKAGYNNRGYADYQSIDIEALADKQPMTLFLVRSHYLIQDKMKRKRANIIDVNDVLDLNSLYLDVDVLLTDYSSAIYPFSLTRKPIVSVQVDKIEYELLRGLYSDGTVNMQMTYVDCVEELYAIRWDNLNQSAVNQHYYDVHYKEAFLSIIKGCEK